MCKQVKRALFALTALCGASAWAAYPTAVWDGDFSQPTKRGFTLDLREGHSLSETGDAVLVGPDATLGVFVSCAKGGFSASTVVFEVEGLTLPATDGAALVSAYLQDAGFNDYVGARITNDGTTRGLWKNDKWGTDAVMQTHRKNSAEELSGVVKVAMTHRQAKGSADSGTHAWMTVGGGWEKILGATALLSTQLSPVKGWTFLGPNGAATAQKGVLPMRGAKLKRVAIYDSVLTTDEIAACDFTYGDPVLAPTTQAVVNHATLPGVSIRARYTLEGAGGVTGWLDLGAGGSLAYDPVKTPILLGGAPTIDADAKLRLVGYGEVACGKVVLMTYPESVSETLGGRALATLVDAASVGGAVDSVEELVAPDGQNRQLVLKWGGYDANAVEFRIMPLGDSITDGFGGEGANYRVALMQKLAAHGYRPIALGLRESAWGKRHSTDSAGVVAPEEYRWNSGVAGARIRSTHRAGLRESVDTVLECSGNPDIVTLKIGTNDIDDSPADMFAGWSNVVWRILKARPNVRVVSASILDAHTAARNERAIAYNGMMRELVERPESEAGAFPAGRVFFCDLYAACPRTVGGAYAGNFLSESDLHPNWVGHDKTSDAWFDAVRSVVDATERTAFVPNTKLGAAENVPEAYRDGFVHVYTLRPEAKACYAKGSAAPYSYVNAAALAEEYGKVAYYVELKGRRSGNVRFVWADMDAFAPGGRIAQMGVPTTYSKWGLVNNLHVYSNDAGIRRVGPDEKGVKGWMQFTKGGAGAAPTAGGPAEVMAGNYDVNDTLAESASYGIMQLHRVFDSPGHDQCAAETLFAYSRWGRNEDGGSEYNEVGIGSFANHGAYTGGGGTTSENYIGTFNFDTVNESAYDVVSIEIWGRPAAGEPPEIPGMRLVFAEEFNGDSLDRRYWTPEVGLVRNEKARQMYIDDASVVSVSNGCLNLTVRHAPGTVNPLYDPDYTGASAWRRTTRTQDYAAGAVDSWGKFAFRYGRLEIRARYSVAQGAWPAVWLVGQDLGSVDAFGDLDVAENHWNALVADKWPSVGEIDLQEYATAEAYSGKVTSSLHYGDHWEGEKYKHVESQLADATLACGAIEDAQWHVYSLDVDESTITVKYDGRTVLTKSQGDLANPDSGGRPFRDNAFYLVFNYALGSMSEEPPPDGSGYPLTMQIDYVRLYQDETKDNGLFFRGSELRKHLTSSFAGGMYALGENDALPLVYSTGTTAKTLTIEMLAQLTAGKGGALCGWKEGGIPVQLVYDAAANRFDVTYTYNGSVQSHAATARYEPQDVAKMHVYTVAVTAQSTGVKVYQDGRLIVDAPKVYWSGDGYKIQSRFAVGAAADLSDPVEGMTLKAVDWYFPAAENDTARALATYEMRLNGEPVAAADKLDFLRLFGLSEENVECSLAITGIDVKEGTVSAEVSREVEDGTVSIWAAPNLRRGWQRVAAGSGDVRGALASGYRFFRARLEPGAVEADDYANVMLADLPSTEFGLKHRKAGEQFRIPSLCKGGNTVVALYDMRPYADDLGSKQSDIGSYSPIDIAGNVSFDGGRSFGEPQVLIDVQNCFDCVTGVKNNSIGYPSRLSDLGDVCTLYDAATRKFLVMGITGGGLSARKSGSPLDSWDCVVYASGSDEIAFGDRRSVRDEIMARLSERGVDTGFTGNQGLLAGPGHGIQTKVGNAGRLVVPMQYFGPDGTRVFAAYSDDHGQTWQVTNLAPGGYNSQENSIAEMDDGSWYMIAKKGGGHGQVGRHLLRTADFENWTHLGEFTPSSSVQGSILKLGQRASDGRGVYAMAFDTSGRTGANITEARHDLKVFFGVDAGESIAWDKDGPLMVWKGSTGAKGYNSMTMVDEGTLGILFEALGHIYYRQVDVSGRLE